MRSLEGPYLLAGREMESPLFNAAGLINHHDINQIIRDAKKLAKTGVGAIQYGSYTIPPSPGNEAEFGSPTDYYNEETGEMTNAKGLPNPGKEAVLRHADELVAIAHEAGKLAIFSVSPTKGAGDSVEQIAQLVEDFLKTNADLVIANVSCPNIVTEGSARKPIMGHDFETMDECVEVLWERVGKTDRLGVKSANHVESEQIAIVPLLANSYRRRNVFSWMECPNTIAGYVPLGSDGKPVLSLPDGAGGLSGPATWKNGREQLVTWYKAVGDFMDIVSTQGIGSGEELVWRLRNGAVAGSMVSSFWNAKEPWARVVDRYQDAVRLAAESPN